MTKFGSHQHGGHFQLMCCQLKMRHMLLIGLSHFIVFWIVIYYLYIYDACHGQAYTAFLCDQFKKGVITGHLCPKLCHSRQMSLTNCLKEDGNYKTFQWEKVLLKSSEHYTDHVSSYEPSSSTPYSRPEKGTNMEQFQDMVTSYVESKLGQGDHAQLIKRIMDVADINSDAKVSLSEAKSIWSLLQHNEFFILLAFGDSEHVPHLQGFCGDLYAIDYHPDTYVYKKESTVWLDYIFPNYYMWFFPSWTKRAKVTVGLLEFTLEIYQHETMGRFYLCDTSSKTIGYNGKFEVKISDVSQIMPKEELSMLVHGRTCRTEQDCIYTKHCTTACDPQTSRCTGEVLRPNLHLVCNIVQDYITVGAPSGIQTELRNLLARCGNLRAYNTTNADMEHSLLLNDLKSLLWQQISNTKEQ